MWRLRATDVLAMQGCLRVPAAQAPHHVAGAPGPEGEAAEEEQKVAMRSLGQQAAGGGAPQAATMDTAARIDLTKVLEAASSEGLITFVDGDMFSLPDDAGDEDRRQWLEFKETFATQLKQQLVARRARCPTT